MKQALRSSDKLYHLSVVQDLVCTVDLVFAFKKQ